MSTTTDWARVDDPETEPPQYKPVWVWGPDQWVEGLDPTDVLLGMYGNSGDGQHHWVAPLERTGPDGQLRPIWGVTHWTPMNTPTAPTDTSPDEGPPDA